MDTEARSEMDVLRAALAELNARVEALELDTKRSGGHTSTGDGPGVDGHGGSVDPFWALDSLRARLGDHPSTEHGAVMLVGSLTLPTGAPVAWQETAGTAGIFDMDWGERAASFAALGHPVRLELLRQILSGVHATADLAAIDTLGTTGQLHHHLRQLVAAGWVRQSGRGSYEVSAARIVPLLASLVGAAR